jgi:ElaB/YqjD/DUF883 family membrane-anchored ribosome-binding protein
MVTTTSKFRDELLALKADAARLLGSAGDEMLKATRERTDQFAGQLNSAFEELGRNLADDEQQIERLVRERPIAALACAFAVGVVAGFAFRRA